MDKRDSWTIRWTNAGQLRQCSRVLSNAPCELAHAFLDVVEAGSFAASGIVRAGLDGWIDTAGTRAGDAFHPQAKSIHAGFRGVVP